MVKIDFHVHSFYSSDAVHNVDQLAREAKKKKLDAIAISDHNTIAKKYSEPAVLVIYGTEVSTAQGHVQVFGTGKTYPKGIDAYELAKLVKEQGGVSIVAHPYSPRSDSLHDLAQKIGATCLEKFNGRDHIHSQRAKEMEYSGTGGSDAHCCQEVGNAWTELECELSEESILEAVKSGKLNAFYKPSRLSLLARHAIRAKNILTGGKVSKFATGKP